MSLLAYAVRPDRVEVVTDSISYTPGFQNISYRDDKVLHLPVANILAVALGGSWVAEQYGWWAFSFDLQCAAAGVALDVDRLAWASTAVLRGIYAEYLDLPREHQPHYCAAHLFGWSPSLDRFAAYHLGSHEPPLDFVASEVATLSGFGERGEWRCTTCLPDRRDWDPADMPTTVDDWIALAIDVRREQSTRPPQDRILTGGDVHLTTLTHDGATTQHVYTYDDSGPDWRRLTADTVAA